MATKAKIRYMVNPRFQGDDIPVNFGSSQDSRILYDAANDEWTVQTKDAGGTFVDRLRIEANTNTPDIIASGANIRTNDAAGPTMLDEAATSTNPTLVPNRADPDTGIGWTDANRLGLISGGIRVIDIGATYINLDQDVDMNNGNIDFKQGYAEFREMTAPGAGIANTVRIYAVVDGGSLTDLAAVFQDGTVDIFAQEV